MSVEARPGPGDGAVGSVGSGGAGPGVAGPDQGRSRPSIDREAVVFDLIMVAFAALIVVTALGIGPRARVVPLVVGVPTLLGLLFLLGRDLGIRVLQPRPPSTETVHSMAEATDDLEAAMAAALEVPEDTPEAAQAARRSKILLAGWAIAYVAGVFLTDFLVATPIALFAILAVTTRRWLLSAIVTAGTCLFLYAVFIMLLKVPV